MSYLHCPYCGVKENSKIKAVYKAPLPIDRKCPDCGAWIDAGQHSVKVNGYADIYKGVLSVIEDVIRQVNNLMDYLEVDTTVDGETPCIRLSTSEIIRTIFVPYAGGTSVNNFKNAIGVEDHDEEFEIKAEQYER